MTTYASFHRYVYDMYMNNEYGPGTLYAKSIRVSTCQDLHLQPAGDFGVRPAAGHGVC